jgi:multidrug efflux pump subunit AcrA (membrane-fusion protein)
MNANVEFITARRSNVLVVPNEAIREQDDRSVVQVLVNGKPGGDPGVRPRTRPVSREVEVGVAGPERTEIRSGLKEGEPVVTRVIERRRPERRTGRSPFQPQLRGRR